MQAGFSKATYLVAVCAVLASCGGGGGGADTDASSSSKVTFTPSSVQVVQVQGVAENIEVKGTISPKPTGQQFLAVIAADKPVVETGQVTLTVNADDSATVGLTTVRTLAAGTHAGELTLHLCRDSQCKDEISLTGNVLPYSIKVIPPVQVQATGDAIPMLGADPGNYWVAPNAPVVSTSNIPVTWSKGSLITGADLQVISSTPTRWEGRILGTAEKFIGVLATSVEKPETNSKEAIFEIRDALPAADVRNGN